MQYKGVPVTYLGTPRFEFKGHSELRKERERERRKREEKAEQGGKRGRVRNWVGLHLTGLS